MIKRFTIRVYGIIIQNGKVLLSTENIDNFIFTKFPGGGLEFEEGTIECLKREIREETACEVENIKHIYTTDYFIQSKIDPEEQVICIYYSCVIKEEIKQLNREHDFRGKKLTANLKWAAKKDVTDLLTFESDKRAWKFYC